MPEHEDGNLCIPNRDMEKLSDVFIKICALLLFITPIIILDLGGRYLLGLYGINLIGDLSRGYDFGCFIVTLIGFYTWAVFNPISCF